jgi:dephospho-CoA kinase
LVVALTGGVGAGKSTVGRALAARGVFVVDTDRLAREALAPGGLALEALTRRFPAVVSGGIVDRAALASLVFDDPDARRDLEAIVHPVVRRSVGELVRAHAGDLVVVEIPLLVETESEAAGTPRSDAGGEHGGSAVTSGARHLGPPAGPGPDRASPDRSGCDRIAVDRLAVDRLAFDRIVVVDVPEEVAVARVVSGRGWSTEAAWARVRAQASREARRARADFVVDNGGDVARLEGEIERLWQWLLAGAPAASAVGPG